MKSGLRGIGNYFIFHPRNLPAIVFILILLVLHWKYHLSLLVFLFVFVIPLSVYFAVLPWIGKKMFPAFERKIQILHLKGKWEEAVKLCRSNVFMRIFGPAGAMKKLYGQSNAFLLRWEKARRAFFEAMSFPDTQKDIGVMIGFAEACFHTCDDSNALKFLNAAVVKKVRFPIIYYYFIHLLIEDEKKRVEAKKIFEKLPWNEDKDASLKNLTYAEILCEEGRIDRAMELLDKVKSDELPPAIRGMAQLLKARLLLGKGRKNEARGIIKDLRRAFPSGRHLIEISDFEDILKK